MDYKKAYKEALAKCKAYIDDTQKRWSEEFCKATEEVFFEIFPELKESEDERIREAQLDYWRSVGGKEWHGVPVQEAIAWLEKQGEQKQVDGFDAELNALLKKYEHLSKEEVAECLSFYLEVVQGEQSKWSEEDEKNLRGIIDEIEANKSEAPDYDLETYNRFLSWLESLKQRIEQQ